MGTRQPFEEVSGMDRLIHDPSRLSILTALASCRSADFLFLQSLTGLTKGNLSNHLGKLEQGGLVTIEKSFRGKVPHTVLALSAQGRKVIIAHWKRLGQVSRAVDAWTNARLTPAEE